MTHIQFVYTLQANIFPILLKRYWYIWDESADEDPKFTWLLKKIWCVIAFDLINIESLRHCGCDSNP